jgi:hypothetical protein
MRDFNFFSEYVYVTSNFKVSKLILPLVYIILFAGLGYAYYYMEQDIDEFQNKYDANDLIIQSNEYKSVLDEERILKSEVASLVALKQEEVAFTSSLPLKYRVTDDLLTKILKAIPRNVSFNSYSINSNGISIDAISSDYSYIAELEYNLNSLAESEIVFIKGISTLEDEQYSVEDELYSFDVNLLFGGGDID